MNITCPKCDRELNVPERAAGKKVRCPRCEALVPVPPSEAAAPPPVPAPGAGRKPTTRRERPEPLEPPEEETSPRPKKKKKKARRDSGIDKRIIAGLAGGGVLLVVIVIVALVVGQRRPGTQRQDAGGANQVAGKAEAISVSGTKVVFAEPVLPLVGAEKRIPPPPPGPPEPTLAPVSLLGGPSAGGDAAGGGAGGSWEGKPDPASAVAPPLPSKHFVYLRNQDPPLLASLDGPFFLEHNGKLAGQPDKAIVGDKESYGALPLKDLRTGKVVAEFAWKTPLWMPVRLSPDGRYVVGPDNKYDTPITNKERLLFVWEKDKAEPVARLKFAGEVQWLDFIAADKVAALTVGKESAVEVWTIGKEKPEQTIALPPGEFKLVQRMYWPDEARGAVSPGRRYLALGGATSVHVVSLAEGKHVGALLLPHKQLWGKGDGGDYTYDGFGFSDKGDELYGLVKTRGHWLATWSLSSGLLTRIAHVSIQDWRGPVLPGPAPGSVVVGYFNFNDDQLVKKKLWTDKGRPFSAAAVVDTASGTVLSAIPSKVLRGNGDGILALSSLQFNPQIPLPPSTLKPEFITQSQKQRQLETWVMLTVDLERDAIRERGTIVAQPPGLPPARPGERTGLVAAKPVPPADWKAPPAPAAPAEGLIGAYNVPNTPPLFGATQVGFVSTYVPTPDAKLIEKLRAAAQAGDKQAMEKWRATTATTPALRWCRYDLRTAQADAPVHLGPMVKSAQTGQDVDLAHELSAAAMTQDGKLLALRDPGDLARVDVWDESGTHLVGFNPHDARTPVQWVGWSPSGWLLTLARGKLTGWDMSAAKAVFEVDGGYGPPLRQVRGGAWLAVAAAAHIDLVDTETGGCLGRCALGDEHDPKLPIDLALSPDASMLACLGFCKAFDWDAMGVVYSWDLATGKVLPRVLTKQMPGRSMVALHGRSVLLDGYAVVDLKSGVHHASYGTPGPSSPRPFPGGPLPASPDGRPWAFGPLERETHVIERSPPPGPALLRPVELPGHDSGPDAKFVFTKETPLLVEVDMGTEERSRSFGQNLVKYLQGQGFTIGRGGWTLRASSELKESETSLTIPGWTGGQVNMPRAMIYWKLYGPDGELANTMSQAAEFGTDSKYFQGKRVVGKKDIFIEVEWTWNFKDRDPATAMKEEVLASLARLGPMPVPPVTNIGKVDGRYQPLPIAAKGVFAPLPGGSEK